MVVWGLSEAKQLDEMKRIGPEARRLGASPGPAMCWHVAQASFLPSLCPTSSPVNSYCGSVNRRSGMQSGLLGFSSVC